jgi:hypothetical protein
MGLDCSLSWLESADGVIAYVGHGKSEGMLGELASAGHLGIPVAEIKDVTPQACSAALVALFQGGPWKWAFP